MTLSAASRALAALSLLSALPSALARAEEPPAPAARSASSSSSPSSSSSGPVLPGEAEILWNRAQEQAAAKKTEDAILTLRRLVDRIPTHARALQAQVLLGRLELERGRAAEALEWFRIAQNNLRGEGPGSRELDLLRARSYLLLGRSSEALLLSEKMLRDADAGKASWGIDAQLIKTRALFRLKQIRRADSSLAAARRRGTSGSFDPAGAALWIEVAELQSIQARCAGFPSSARLAEDQAIDQIGRHAECVLQARAQHEKIVAMPQQPATIEGSQARTDAEASWAGVRAHFRESCENPPAPIEKRRKGELAAYLSELKLAFQPACTKASAP